jgi:hypothetical protein
MRALCVAVLAVFAFASAGSAAEVVLKTKWIEDHKNRVTVISEFPIQVDTAHKKPNPTGEGAADGDLHMAGRAPAVGLPMVAEIVNGIIAANKDVLADVKATVGSGHAVNMNGVWRLWFEHPSAQAQTQGQTVPVPKNTNPDHSFEIHPVTHFGTRSLNDDFVPISGYTAHAADASFKHYESQVFTVTKNATFTSIVAKKAGFNYADFVLVAAGPPKQSTDGGWMVLATVRDVSGHVLVSIPRRMVAAPGTRPADAVSKLKTGDRLHVIAIPRVNLERLMAEATKTPGKPTTVKGAYEMILVGVE